MVYAVGCHSRDFAGDKARQGDRPCIRLNVNAVKTTALLDTGRSYTLLPPPYITVCPVLPLMHVSDLLALLAMTPMYDPHV